MNLSDFLLARIAEDEAEVAPFVNDFGVTRGWHCDEIGGKVRDNGPMEFGLPDVIAETTTHFHAEHIARWDPARVLAECAAKRRIVDEYEETRDEAPPTERYDGQLEALETVVRFLALPYAAHADFRDEWRAYAASRG